ncbi:MAG TPA: Uma2 family endonuclease [Saprospiraceae bacterium]|nr:Uma2 family endonuclease [Saprospiraceae bacterium]
MIALDVIEKTYTIAEYLERKDSAMVRHEFYNGTIQEMAGGMAAHSTIKGRIYSLLDRILEESKAPHVPLNSDAKIRIEDTNAFVYPDVTISDGMPEYYTTPHGSLCRDIVNNPLSIIEVLSDHTCEHDKGIKWENYTTIPGFREYVLVEPESVWVKSLFLQDPHPGLWKIQTLTDLSDTLTLQALKLQFALADIYSILSRLPQDSAA